MLTDPDFRELVTLPISIAILKALLKAGYTNIGEVWGLSIDQISSVCQISRQKAASVLKTVHTYANICNNYKFEVDQSAPINLFQPNSALDLLKRRSNALESLENSETNGVVCMSKCVDDILGGGFPCGRITEICGQSGIGKTQFCLQACLTVQLPRWCGGLAGEAVFLDTEGNFMTKRLHQMAVHLVQHCNSNIRPKLDECKAALVASEGCNLEKVTSDYATALTSLPTIECLMDKVYYIRCTDFIQLLAAIKKLDDFCVYHPQIRLIVLDSIALPFRYEFDDIPQRNRLLASISQSLLLLAGSQNAAVIVTNQITTRFKLNPDGTSDTSKSVNVEGQLVPALGDSWGHICSVRLLLKFSESNCRTAQLLKHPGRPPACAKYEITMGGIRDVF